MIGYTCPHCGKALQVPEKYIGHTGACSGCKEKFKVEAQAQVVEFAAAASSKNPKYLIYGALIVLGLLSVWWVLSSGSSSVKLPPSQLASINSEPRKTINFDGKKWELVGPTTPIDMWRPSMIAVFYTNANSGENVRLIEMVVNESSSLREGAYARILQIQINQGGSWIHHGQGAVELLTGGWGEIQYQFGKIHGMQREWYPNGQLHILREWADDEMHGREQGWWEDGKRQYDAMCFRGQEVSGKFWDQDGTLRE